MEHAVVDTDLEGFVAWRCSSAGPAGLSHVVEVGAPGRRDGTDVAERGSVLLVHELMGVSDHTVALAWQLRSAGYRVWMPVLFGEPGVGVGLVEGVRQICVRSELRSLALRGRTPLSKWLAELVELIVADRAVAGAPPGIAAVGMCLTGGLVLPLVLRPDPAVDAAVAAQPSSPIRPGVWQLAPGARNLGLTPDERGRAATNTTPVLALSFQRDAMCPARRRAAVRDLLATDAATVVGRGRRTLVEQHGALRTVEAAGVGHATLTAHAERADGETVAELLRFLDEALPA